MPITCKSSVMSLLLLLVTGLVHYASASADGVYFVYSTPGSTRGWAGLYGGKFKRNESPNNLDLEQTRIATAHYGNSYFNGFNPNGLSYDPISKDLLMSFLNSNLLYSLAKVNPCENEVIEKDKLYFKGRHNVLGGPFALYDSHIYFLARELHAKGQSVFLTMTINKVTRCLEDDTFLNTDGVDNKYCSVQVAKISEQEIFTTDEETEFGPDELFNFNLEVKTVGSKLLVIKEEDQLYFLVQIANPAWSDGDIGKYSLDLYEVKEGGEYRDVRILHSSSERLEWVNNIIYNLGDISYKDGLLCWSTYESVLCEKWPRTENPIVHQVIKPGDNFHVCNFSSDNQDYQNIINGVAIVSGKDNIQLLFGCWSSVTSNGGAGYLFADSNGSVKQIKPVADRKGKIFAGNIVIIDECSQKEDWVVYPGVSTSGAPTSCFAELTLITMLLIPFLI